MGKKSRSKSTLRPRQPPITVGTREDFARHDDGRQDLVIATDRGQYLQTKTTCYVRLSDVRGQVPINLFISATKLLTAMRGEGLTVYIHPALLKPTSSEATTQRGEQQ